MFRTRTPIKDNETGSRWFVVNSFANSFADSSNDSIVLPRQNLQSINPSLELRTVNKEEKNDARRVSEGFGELITDFKFSGKPNNLKNNLISEQKVEVINNRYDLRGIAKDEKSLDFGYYQ